MVVTRCSTRLLTGLIKKVSYINIKTSTVSDIPKATTVTLTVNIDDISDYIKPVRKESRPKRNVRQF